MTCRICELYIGAPDVIRRHEASHFDPIEELPDYSDIYRSMRDDLEQPEEDEIPTEDERRNREWEDLILELFDPHGRSRGSADLQISIKLDGDPLDVERFKRIVETEIQRQQAGPHGEFWFLDAQSSL